MIILHCALGSSWHEATKEGTYGADYLENGNFIPCMKITDINSDNFSFSSMKDYVILCIDEAKVTSEIKYEKLDANDFESPNIYGPLNVDAVIDTIPYTFDSEDKFIMNSNLRGISLINQVMADMNLEYLSHRFFNDRNI